MAERGKPQPTPPASAPASLSTLPVDALRARTAMFLRMTQGEGKPMQYPAPPKGKRGD